ncbi:armadillo-type protein [Blastocladiella britannica]|nr:armadillo-type protein [Blastocladiella britannica]
MDAQTLGRVESLCRTLYTSPAAQERVRAEAVLARAFPTFSTTAEPMLPIDDQSLLLPFSAAQPIEGLAQTSVLLRQTADLYTQTYAVNHLKSLVLHHFALLSTEEKVQLKVFIMTYFSENVGAERMVITSLTQVLTLIVKVAWFEAETFTKVIEELSTFIHASVDHQILGAHILNDMVSEMNNPQLNPLRVAKLRKAVIAFRETNLIQVFQTGISFLNRFHGNSLTFTSDMQKLVYIEHAMMLIRSCLTFDFIGTSPDESSDDVTALQVPSSWRPVVDETFIQLLFQTYRVLALSQVPRHQQSSSKVMEAISQAVSIRRSLFNDKERVTWLSAIIRGLSTVMEQAIGMVSAENYHELCKTLSRLKITYNLSEMVQCGSGQPAENQASPEFLKWIRNVTQFSVQGFSAELDWSPISDSYLLTFWAKCSSTSSSPVPSQEEVDQCTLVVVECYINSRIAACVRIVEDDLEDLFEDEDALINNLETLATSCRRCYESVAQYAGSTFASALQSYRTTGARIAEHQLTFLVYLASAMIGARMPYQSPESQDSLDGELSCAVLETLQLNQRAPTMLPAMNSAVMYFFSQFRKSYIGESAHRTSRVYESLAMQFQVDDQEHAMELIASQVLQMLRSVPGPGSTNDKAVLTRQSELAFKSLRLLHDLSTGYVTVKLLAKMDAVKALTAEHAFPFLDTAPKSRALYYTILSRILFTEDTPTTVFPVFVAPFEEKLAQLAQVVDESGGSVVAAAANLSEPSAQMTLVGLFRDLRGLLISMSLKQVFQQYWEWIYPEKLSLLRSLMEVVASMPEVSVALLKLFYELSLNRSSRLVFDSNSVNGILLFRETSILIQTYASHAVQVTVSDARAWPDLYKGTAACMRMLKVALSGNYVNFGVLLLYGDDSLESALAAISAMVMRIPVEHVMQYPKLAQAFFELCETLTQPSNLQLVQSLSPSFFAYMGQVIISALQPPPTMATPANTIDNIVTFLCTEEIRRASSSSVSARMAPRSPGGPLSPITPGGARSARPVHCVTAAFAQYPDLLTVWMSQLLNTLFFDDSTIQWSLSRPLLPLVMLNKEHFDGYCNTIIQSQLPRHQETVSRLMGNLLKDMDNTLTQKARDRLTNAINQFRRDLATDNISLIFPQNQ